jgi:transposase
MYILGIDLAKKTFDVTLLTPTGTRDHHSFANTLSGFRELWRWLRAHGATSVRACMEATNVYWQALAQYLVEQDATVHVVKAAGIKGYAQSQMLRNKTDHQWTMRELLTYQVPPPAWAPPKRPGRPPKSNQVATP